MAETMMHPFEGGGSVQSSAQGFRLMEKTAHSLYQRTYPSPQIHSEDSAPTQPPDFSVLADPATSTMRSPGASVLSSGCSIDRNTSAASRRSVKVMKNLLPLKLSSPQLVKQSPPIPPLTHTSTFGVTIPQLPHGQAASQHGTQTKVSNTARLPIKIRPDKYRDTPFYTEVGSPVPDRAYHFDDDVCLSCSPTGSSCDESCIFQDYASSSDSDYEPDEDTSYHGLGFDFGAVEPQKRPRPKSSDLSFKCRGEASSYGTSMFPDEAAWLSSSIPRTDITATESLPHLPLKHNSIDRDAEGWLSEASSCEDDDELGCATALTLPTVLAPARAHVIDVNLHPVSLSLNIPPRSSSLINHDAGRKSRMTFRDNPTPDTPHWNPLPLIPPDWKTNDGSNTATIQHSQQIPPNILCEQFDLARASPPVSPKEQFQWNDILASQVYGSLPASDPSRNTSFRTYSSASNTTQSPTNSFASLISIMEDCIVNFPSALLLPDSPAIAAIRPLLRGSLFSSQSPLDLEQQRSLVSLRYSDGVDRRPERGLISHKLRPDTSRGLQRSISLSTLSTFRTVQMKPRSVNTFGLDTPRPYSTSSAQHFSTTPTDRKLQNIFPDSSSFHRAALYSHILAYAFLDTLTSPQGILATTSYALPSKVIEVLGAPPVAARPARVNIQNGVVVYHESSGGVELCRVECLLHQAKGCIRWLIAEMDSPKIHHNHEKPSDNLDELVLRALIEVVRGCEQDLSMYF